MGTTTTTRPLHVIAREIRDDWTRNRGGIYFGAVPYLDAMKSLASIGDTYGQDSADDIVRYFLSNATTWRGDVARRVKVELKGMLKRFDDQHKPDPWRQQRFGSY